MDCYLSYRYNVEERLTGLYRFLITPGKENAAICHILHGFVRLKSRRVKRPKMLKNLQKPWFKGFLILEDRVRPHEIGDESIGYEAEFNW